MGLLRSVKDGAVPMDGHQLNGANRGMERNVGQEARLNVVKMVSSGYTRNSISYKSYYYLILKYLRSYCMFMMIPLFIT